MKKSVLILLFSLLFINQAFSMEEQEQSKPVQKTQLTGWDKAKICGAIGGSLFFTWATLFNYNTRIQTQDDPSVFRWYHYPTIVSLIPTAIAAGFIEKYKKEKYDNNNTLYNIVAGYTSLAALGLGYYAFKKMTQSKNKTEKS